MTRHYHHHPQHQPSDDAQTGSGSQSDDSQTDSGDSYPADLKVRSELIADQSRAETYAADRDHDVATTITSANYDEEAVLVIDTNECPIQVESIVKEEYGFRAYGHFDPRGNDQSAELYTTVTTFEPPEPLGLGVVSLAHSDDMQINVVTNTGWKFEEEAYGENSTWQPPWALEPLEVSIESPDTVEAYTMFDVSAHVDTDGRAVESLDWSSSGLVGSDGSSASYTFAQEKQEQEISVEVIPEEGRSTTVNHTVDVVNPFDLGLSVPSTVDTYAFFSARVIINDSEDERNVESTNWSSRGLIGSDETSATYRFFSEMEVDITVEVTMEDGVSREASQTVSVQDSNLPPWLWWL